MLCACQKVTVYFMTSALDLDDNRQSPMDITAMSAAEKPHPFTDHFSRVRRYQKPTLSTRVANFRLLLSWTQGDDT